jgi:hypothetical protein
MSVQYWCEKNGSNSKLSGPVTLAAKNQVRAPARRAARADLICLVCISNDHWIKARPIKNIQELPQKHQYFDLSVHFTWKKYAVKERKH